MDINEIILNDLDEEFLNADITHFRDEWDHYMHEKQYIPRVTQIIHSCQLDNQSLVLWANKMGLMGKKSEAIRDSAAQLGNFIHEALEEYVKHGVEPDYDSLDTDDRTKNKIEIAIKGFKAFWSNYRYKDQVKSVTTEKKIITPYYGGTYDLMVTLKDGRKFLYDFKTTNSVRDSQFLQLAAYNYGLRTYYNTILSGVAILKIDKYRPSCKEFFLDFENPNNVMFMNHCECTFISMLHTYYNLIRTKLEFENYLKER